MQSLVNRITRSLAGAAVTAALIGVAAPVATAAPLNPSTIPDGTMWLAHVDFDALAKTSLWQDFQHAVKTHRRLAAVIREVQTITGTNISSDLEDVTLFGSSFSPDAPVLVLRGSTDKAKLINAVKLNKDYAKIAYGHYTLRSWSSNGQRMYGAYHDEKTIVIAHSATSLEQELDLLDGKGASLTPQASLTKDLADGIFLYVSGKNLWQLHAAGRAQSPLLTNLREACVGIGEHDNYIEIHATLIAKTSHDAMLMQTALDGLRSMAELASQGNSADAKTQLIGRAASGMSAQVLGRELKISWPIPLDLIKQAAELKMHPHAAADQNTGN